jgi:hypothetical protein
MIIAAWATPASTKNKIFDAHHGVHAALELRPLKVATSSTPLRSGSSRATVPEKYSERFAGNFRDWHLAEIGIEQTIVRKLGGTGHDSFRSIRSGYFR